ncbi:Neuronal PAS domain-containing protein 2 [Exaiptasia diaphana]|nr:Neuronal PAS domain-containing protein 2 [Exaiptasia diaphana]
MMMDDYDDGDDSNKNPFQEKGPSVHRRATRNESEKKRRDKLNIYIQELASMVPSCFSSKKKLDKTSVLKMTVNFMRMHNDLTGSVLGNEYGLHLSFLTSDDIGDLMDKSLNSFLFVLSSSWKIVYVSKSITPILGLEWDQIEGSNFMNLVHPDDKDIVINELNSEDKSVYLASSSNGIHKIPKKPSRHVFDIRMTCSPSNQRVENVDLYERVHVLGYTDTWEVKKANSVEEQNANGSELVPRDKPIPIKAKPLYFVAVGFLSRPAVQRFVDIDKSLNMEFESRHTMDGKFLFVDPRSITMTGYLPYELLGTSIYNYVHHDDMHVFANFHQSLLEYGECKTEPYRMRSKGHQWIWMKSRSFISYNHWNSKPEFICSTNMAVCDRQEMKIQDKRCMYTERTSSSGLDNIYQDNTALPLLSTQSLQEILPTDRTYQGWLHSI